MARENSSYAIAYTKVKLMLGYMKEKIRGFFLATSKLIIWVYFISWILKGSFFNLYQVPTGSMYPTVKRGDYVLVTKLPYLIRSPETFPLTDIEIPSINHRGLKNISRNEIIAFKANFIDGANGMPFIKRCVGVPGDTMYYYFKEKKYFYSLKPTDEEGEQSFIIPYKGMEITIDNEIDGVLSEIIHRDVNIRENYFKKGQYIFNNNFYFFSGDNKDRSYDSRYWGIIPEYELIGIAKLIIWSKYNDQIFELL